MEEEKLVSLEVAKLAKKKGFNWSTFAHWGLTRTPEGMMLIKFDDYQVSLGDNKAYGWNGEDWAYEKYSAPSQSLLQKWLRDIHQICVFVVPSSYGDSDPHIQDCWGKVFHDSNNVPKGVDNGIRYTYEEALEFGLKKALKINKSKKEK